MNKFKAWCGSNTAAARLTRTIFQGIIGVLIANIDIILGYYVMDAQTRAIVVAFVMAVLAPIQSALGTEEISEEPVD